MILVLRHFAPYFPQGRALARHQSEGIKIFIFFFLEGESTPTICRVYSPTHTSAPQPASGLLSLLFMLYHLGGLM